MKTRMAQLGELIEIKKGKKASQLFDRPSKTSRCYLQIDDLRPGAKPKYTEPFACPIAKCTDVIIAWDGANAGTVSCNLDGYIGSTLAVLHPTTDELFAPYLSRFLETKFDHLQANSTGATIPHLSRDVLEEIQLPFPDLSEQRRIAGRLEQADRLLRTRHYALELTDNLLPAAFRELFGSPSECPTRFPYSELGEVTDFIDYRGIAPNKSSSGVRLITARNVKRGYFEIDPQEFIPAEDYDRWMTRGKPRPGDVLFTTEGHTLGSAAMLPPFEKAALAQRLIVLQPGKHITSSYLLHLIITPSFQNAVVKRSTGSAARGISSKNLAEISIPVPPRPLQQQFAALVERVERLRAVQREALRQAEHLFASLLHRAFSG